MDGSFACPECGSEVEVAGLAPGRQVRCGFCHRLLEVPYLPRVSAGTWKRRRFGHLKWVRWAWVALGATVVVALGFVAIRFVGRQYHSIRERSIHELVASSRDHEADGRLNQALVELDAAIEMARGSGETVGFAMDEERRHRAELARREVEGVLDALARPGSRPSYPLGDWLNLVARAGKDPDLEPLKPRVESTFRESLRKQAASELDTAGLESDAGRVAASLRACDRVAKLLPHMAADGEAITRRDAETLVTRLVEGHGVALETPRFELVIGSYESYRTQLVPILLDGLEAKGYLPYRESSPWKAAWRRAKYLLRLEVIEKFQGTYLSSENRLTRIEARLGLTKPSSGELVWQTMPTARTTVPLPGLPAYVSSQAALSSERSPKFERLLYDNARGQIDEKVGQNLASMPACCR